MRLFDKIGLVCSGALVVVEGAGAMLLIQISKDQSIRSTVSLGTRAETSLLTSAF